MWLIIIIFIILTALLILNIFYALTPLVANLITIGGYVLLLIKLSYEHSTWLNLQIKKLQFMFNKNTDVLWSMEIRTNGEYNETTLNRVDHYLNNYNGSVRVLKSTPSIRIVRVKSMVIEFYLTDESLNISAIDNQMSYKRAKRVFEEELSELLEGLISYLGSNTCDCFIKVKFENENPFFGLLIKDVKKEDLISFDVTLRNGNNKVTISTDSITFYSNSLNSVNIQAKQYLSLYYKPIKEMKGSTI